MTGPLTMHPAEPKVPTYDRLANEVLAWLIEGKEIGLRQVAEQLAFSRPDDPFCRAFIERIRAELQDTGQGPLACDAPLDQPIPRQNGGEPVLPAARAEFLRVSEQQERKGIAKYGVALRTQNGRNPIADAKQEAVDLWHYLQQADMERAELHAALRRWVEAGDAFRDVSPTDEHLWMTASEAELDLLTLARSVLGVGEP